MLNMVLVLNDVYAAQLCTCRSGVKDATIPKSYEKLGVKNSGVGIR